MAASIDLELTNRCNAKCDFCPRDMTPHQGLMSVEVFEQALARAVEYRELAAPIFGSEPQVSLCGLGEPLLNKHAMRFARQVTDEGFRTVMSSNGALLDERKATGLLDAGLKAIYLNVGDIGESYEAVYQLPFAKTRDNIVRFIEMAGDRCDVYIVLVDYKRDADHLAAMKAYWGDLGVDHFQQFDIINRGGALFVDHMQFESLPQLAEARGLLDPERTGRLPVCSTPFAYLFVGYDGNYYLCCSDWTKEVPLGTVFDRSFTDIMRDKFEHVSRRDSICRTCNLDPLNEVTDELRAIADGESAGDRVADLVTAMVTGGKFLEGGIEQLQPGVTRPVEPRPVSGPKLIPLTVR